MSIKIEFNSKREEERLYSLMELQKFIKLFERPFYIKGNLVKPLYILDEGVSSKHKKPIFKGYALIVDPDFFPRFEDLVYANYVEVLKALEKIDFYIFYMATSFIESDIKYNKDKFIEKLKNPFYEINNEYTLKADEILTFGEFKEYILSKGGYWEEPSFEVIINEDEKLDFEALIERKFLVKTEDWELEEFFERDFLIKVGIL